VATRDQQGEEKLVETLGLKTSVEAIGDATPLFARQYLHSVETALAPR